MGSIKDCLYYRLVRKNKDVQYEYERYVMENIKEHYEKRSAHWKILLQLKWHYQIKKSNERMLFFDEAASRKIMDIKDTVNKNAAPPQEKILYYENDFRRESVNKFAAGLMDYDVISFDIFDTLIYRKVEKPNDIFHIMSAEMEMNDFASIRKKAESTARDIKEKQTGSREVVLKDIYDILEDRFNIERRWMQREISLEINMSMPNDYMHQIYQMLLKFDKTVVFTTDMYLPLNIISKMVEKNGYTDYNQIILSNEYGLRKGDGTLQQILLEKFPDKKIVHIGDNYRADVEKSIDAGIHAVHNPDSHFVYREPELENIAGSFYRSVIQTNMNNGLWEKDLYYSHGYRVGGILAAGYCNFINQVVERKKIDKILFCARDCEIIYDIYNQFYKKADTAYIHISRYAIFNITSEHYLYDLSERYIMRYMKMYRSNKTIEMILNETGYGFLVDELEKNNIDRFQFPCAVDEKRISDFIFKCAKLISKKNERQKTAAKQYFSDLLGDAENVLVVDIGWSGTCITALKYFIQENRKDKQCRISGTLMCTNRNELIKNSIQFEEIEAYINTPFDNMDITRFIFPGPPKSRNPIAMDMLHMPLEYLFTSAENSLLEYSLDESSNVTFKLSKNRIPNPDQIRRMQEGIRDFVRDFLAYSQECKAPFAIPPYTAFGPLREAIRHERYAYEVYKDFLYDAMSPVYPSERVPVYGELFDNKYMSGDVIMKERKHGKKILFIGPEMIYSGAPRSLLRMCKAARDLGYDLTVWSAKDGPFKIEYYKEGIPVKIIKEEEIQNYISQIETFDLAVCNTVMSSMYAEICCQHIPTIWYIREATNIPDFIRNNPERAYAIKNSPDICVVSNYAAKALELYADYPIMVVRNCVEDESDMALPYIAGTDEKVKFVQFGTMEYRKGYDVLLAAYKAMPKAYQEKSELYFAGGFINSGTPFCSYLFREMKEVEGVHYLGLIKGETDKIETLSKMDVVVVASRDESCSLVALEGAMLSKPLIVTENVGAKYIVGEGNGAIVGTGDTESLKIALMAMIDKKEFLGKMGISSRENYEKMASMDTYTRSMKELYALSEIKGTEEFIQHRNRNREVFSEKSKLETLQRKTQILAKKTAGKDSEAIVSLTSHPKRISVAEKCIRTLIDQTVQPIKLILWLSKDEFPEREKDIPHELVVLKNTYEFFDIIWVDGDLKPHKKYFYAMQQWPDNPVIIVDDDVFYDPHLVEYLLESYERFPDCVSAMRVNLMGFRRDGSIMDYEGWTMGYRMLQDTPSTQLVPTGVGGVLYPPHSLPQKVFDRKAIEENCLYCDDLWLKIFASHAGFKTVMPEKFCVEKLIEGSQDAALWKMNVRYGNNNDVSLKNILKYYEQNIGEKEPLMRWLRKDRFC